MDIKKVAVIGSGVMGSGIAAQVANAGIPVLLLDIVPEGATDRNVLPNTALKKLKKADPAPLMHPSVLTHITTGNLEDNLSDLAGYDWIIEVVLEDLKVKQDLYARLENVRQPGAVVSSNTSTIPLQKLVEGRSDAFRKDFMVTHFFNPPRYMRLLELVTSKHTRAEAVDTVRRFCDERLGKGVVVCNDTPGFIANRIGAFWMETCVNQALDMGLTVEEADAIAGRPMGIPKTGVFGLLDLIGLDLMPHIARSLTDTLPEDDEYVQIHREPKLFKQMIADGYTGRKGKGGFYRLNREGGKKVKEAIDLTTGDYRPAQKVVLSSVDAGKKGLRALVDHPDKGGRYAWDVIRRGLSYAASLVPEVAGSLADVDAAMRWGYNWKKGPFEMIDALGTDWFAAKLKDGGHDVPMLLQVADGRPFYRVEDGVLEVMTTKGDYAPVQRPDGVLLLEDIKRAGKPVAKNGSASVWDISDGVLCLEFHTKMNAFDPQSFEMIHRAITLIGDGDGSYKALVIYNEASHFSAGANLGMALFALNIGLYPQIEELVEGGQDAYKALKYAPFPVVGAPAGMALGGGCEILLHCDAVQAAAETYAGLVEVGVGLIPAWGGCKEMLARHAAKEKGPRGPMPAVRAAFETIGLAKVAKSAMEARDLMILRDDDGITMNRDRLLADAKAKALALVEGYTPPEPADYVLPGPTARAAVDLAVADQVKLGNATPHDVTVTGHLAAVLSGGDTDITRILSEDDVLELEREHFMQLVRTTPTIDRIEHMLETGKPLRN